MTASGELTAIICDNQPAQRQAVSRLLDQAGCSLVVETPSLARMMEIVVHAQPDVAVLDLAMTGLEGLDAVRELRRICASCTIIVLSPFIDLRAEALAAGATDLVDADDLRGLARALSVLHMPSPRSGQDTRLGQDIAPPR